MIILGRNGRHDPWTRLADRIARADRPHIPIYHQACHLAWRVVIKRALRD
jgi:hypothetical protein